MQTPSPVPSDEQPVPAPSVLVTRPRARRPAVSVARALGSDTRAGIYEHLRNVGAALTVRDVAGVFDLHPNVARTHLETLADAGLVVVGRRKHPGGGRPAKVYLAREEAAAATEVSAQREPVAAQLLVRLLLLLLDSPLDPGARATSGRGGTQGGQLAARAHEAAATEGRRLVAALGVPAADGIDAAAETALRALRPYAPQARVVKAGEDWVDLAGLRGVFALARQVRADVADALERGLLAGALAAAGVPVTVGDAGTVGSGQPAWRARALSLIATRAGAAPSSSVDARGLAREAGVVEAMRAVTALHPGEVLEVLAEGPGSPAAFARWADRAGHELLGVERAVDGEGRPAIRLLLRKGRESR